MKQWLKKIWYGPDILVHQETISGSWVDSLVSAQAFPDVTKIYQELNYAIRNNHEKVVYPVTQMDSDVFLSVYHAIRYDYLIKTDVFYEPMSKQEFFEFDLSSYSGPRISGLIPRITRYLPRENTKARQDKISISREENVVKIHFKKA